MCFVYALCFDELTERGLLTGTLLHNKAACAGRLRGLRCVLCPSVSMN